MFVNTSRTSHQYSVLLAALPAVLFNWSIYWN